MKISYLPESDPKHPHREFNLHQLLPLQMLKRNRGYILTSQGAKKLTEAKREWETQHENRCTQEKIRQLTRTLKPPEGLDPGTIRKILKGEKGVDKESIRCLFIAFSLQLDDDDLEQVTQNDVANLISSRMKESETGQALMSLATSMLEQLGFKQKFRMNTTSEYIGYRLINTGEGSKQYQLLLAKQPKCLSICIHENFFDLEILQLMDYVHEGYFDRNGNELTKEQLLGKVWVLPSKEDIFLKSMQLKYPNILKGQVTGRLVLKDWDDDRWAADMDGWYSLVTEEFNIENLSDRDSYLIVQENKLFPYTGEVCISSKEILQEFIDNFGLIIMNK